MTDELTPQEPVLTPELQEAIGKAITAAQERATIDAAPELEWDKVPSTAEPFVITPELQAAMDAAIAAVKNRTYAGRNPQLGKMFNCAVCRSRHRKNEIACVQVFTNRVDHDNYELLKDDENGNLVPDYRTCAREGERPTQRQVVGAAAFNKKRFHPHPSKGKLLFIERTREIFLALDFPFQREEDAKETKEEFNETFQKNLQRARVLAARELRSERHLRTRAKNRQADKARRINKGLL
jgi:hypothetical protein